MIIFNFYFFDIIFLDLNVKVIKSKMWESRYQVDLMKHSHMFSDVLLLH